MADEAVFVTRSVCLSDIARKAEWVKHDAADLVSYAKCLVSLPTWDTEAEDAVTTALAAVHDALGKLADVDAIMKAKRETANKVPV